MSFFFQNWLGQLLFLSILSLLLLIIRRLMGPRWSHWLLVIDFWPPFLLVMIHFLTVQATRSSIVPYVVLSLALFGIGLTIYETYQRGEIVYSRFFRIYWRICDLVLICVYVLALVLKLI